MGVAAGLRALLDYLASEPAHAHLTLVDTFAASPRRSRSATPACTRSPPTCSPVTTTRPRTPCPGVAPEAIAGGIWQVLHNYIEHERTDELPDVAPQLIYAALTPFLGPKDAAKVARRAPAQK